MVSSEFLLAIRMKLIIDRSEAKLSLAEINEGLLVHSLCLLWELTLLLIGWKVNKNIKLISNAVIE